MSEFKGTPGPWFAGRLIKEGDDYGSISVGPYPLRENKDFHYEDTICQLDEGEHDISANARLIAAAPDLLEALEIAEVTIRLDSERLRDCDRTTSQADYTLALIQSVRAKALQS